MALGICEQTTRLVASDANDFVNAKSHAGKKPLLEPGRETRA